jgi:hypothetical protein
VLFYNNSLQTEFQRLRCHLVGRLKELFTLSITIVRSSETPENKDAPAYSGIEIHRSLKDSESGNMVHLKDIVSAIIEMNMAEECLQPFFVKLNKHLFRRVIEDGDQDEEGRGVHLEVHKEDSAEIVRLHYLPYVYPMLNGKAEDYESNHYICQVISYFVY